MSERYAIQGEIGRGGTALVYRARDRDRGIDVALKVMREDLMSSVSVERFLMEVRQTERLTHPHIVPVLDSGRHEGRPYFVLPFMDGGTLREKLQRHKQLPFDEVITLGVTIARALDFAHAQGVIHRDVKPENILYTNGRPCLADFGTARALERAANDPTTSTGIVRGTAAYMSPEQASGDRDYDGRTDLYSLACVLYECVAGVQPFVGPSMQAVISQRLAHAPRPVSVYRPSVPAELEHALVKATALAPADRFKTAGEFADALERVPPGTGSRSTPIDVRMRVTRTRRALTGAMLVVAAMVTTILLTKGAWWNPFAGRVPIDTTLVAILPVESTGSLDPTTGQELLIEGLRAWTGISAVETFSTNDAIRREGRGAPPAATASALSIADVADVVHGLGAGRFVKARVTETSGLRGVYATLYDVKTKRDLYHARVPLPADSSMWANTFASLMDSLILRGAPAAGRSSSRVTPPNLASYQIFLRARDALAVWDLPLADSLFAAATQLDSLNTRALFWGAQVRSWRNRNPATWARGAGVAARDSMNLAPSERTQARALAALGAGDYEKARLIYREMSRANPFDFAAWYGLGTAHRVDRVILKDPTSISGYRFRASYEQAVQAYARAYELLPSAHRSVESGGFELLRQWMFTWNILRAGSLNGAPPYTFYSRVNLDHDTVVFVPYLRDTVLAGPPQTDPSVVGRALTRNRRMFQRVVSGWRASFPGAVGTREAVAISMEMLGDPAAADSFIAIRRDAPRAAQLRLAVAEAMSRLKMSVSERPEAVASSRALADSILGHAAPATADEYGLLARLAVLTGRCAQASELVTHVPLRLSVQLPPSLVQKSIQAFAAWAAGCGGAETFPAISVEMERAGTPRADAVRAEYELLGAAIAMEYPASASGIRRLATEQDYVLRAETHLLQSDTASARRLLARYRDARLVAPPGDLAPDAALIEARLWLTLGDTAIATQLLDKVLSEFRFIQPMALADPVQVHLLQLGAIGPAMELRARLARERSTRDRWVATLAALWGAGDDQVKRRVQRLAQSQGAGR